jgi:hypothetical protein
VHANDSSGHLRDSPAAFLETVASREPSPPYDGQRRYASIRDQHPAPPRHFGAPRSLCTSNLKSDRSESQPLKKQMESKGTKQHEEPGRTPCIRWGGRPRAGMNRSDNGTFLRFQRTGQRMCGTERSKRLMKKKRPHSRYAEKRGQGICTQQAGGSSGRTVQPTPYHAIRWERVSNDSEMTQDVRLLCQVCNTCLQQTSLYGLRRPS